MLIVACAVIIYRGKILICQRGEGMNLPFKWEFPGGKAKSGEDERQAIVREIREELQLDIEVVERWTAVEHTYPTFRIQLIPFVARVSGGRLTLVEHHDARWVSVSELKRYDWAPADVPIVRQIEGRAADLNWLEKNDSGRDQ